MTSHPFIPCPGVVQVQVVFTANSKQVMNVYHVKKPTVATSPTMDELSSIWTDFAAWEHDHMRTARNSHSQVDAIKLRDLTHESGLTLERSDGMPYVGLDTDADVPNNVTAAVSLRTDFGGKSFRGRSYFVGMSQTATDQNKLVPATQSGLVAAYSALLTILVEGSGFHLGVLSLRHANAWRGVGVWTEVTHITVNLGLDSMRRRLDKGH